MGQKLNQAMAKAQAEFVPPVKAKKVKGRTYDFFYADFDAIVTAWKAHFPKHGISFRQSVGEGTLNTIIACDDEEACHSVPFPGIDGKTPQEAGSLLTYYKRYGFCMAFGIVAEDDDDGEMAAKTVASAPEPRRSPMRQPEPSPEPSQEDRLTAFYKRDKLTIPRADTMTMREWVQKLEHAVQHAPSIDVLTRLQMDNEDVLDAWMHEDRDGYTHLQTLIKARNVHLVGGVK